jgi:hypothetical protein
MVRAKNKHCRCIRLIFHVIYRRATVENIRGALTVDEQARLPYAHCSYTVGAHRRKTGSEFDQFTGLVCEKGYCRAAPSNLATEATRMPGCANELWISSDCEACPGSELRDAFARWN